MPLPESTYRLQFHAGFTFRDAAAIVPYLHDLGVTHRYASPYLKARPGSTHGYDVIDHGALNPELGTQEDYDAFVEALRSHGMGHILDIVPNHVGVATNDNAWWNDVLEHGPASRYANYFDIAWRGSPRPELHDKVMLPLLGAPYGQVLEKGELKLVSEDGKVRVAYHDRRFPLRPESAREIQSRGGVDAFNGAPGEPRSFDALDELLNRQHYRLSYWRVAPDEINYRRFFDINDLAALSMEREEVFRDTHALILQLVVEGKVDGLRVDHPDGLHDPKRYFERLQRAYVDRARSVETETRHPPLPQGERETCALYVVAEKILAPDEPLPDDWPVHGTTGYDFLNMVNGLFVDQAAEEPFTRLYQEWTGDDTTFEDLVYEKKRLILDVALASELQMLAHRLDRFAQKHRRSRDYTLSGLRGALREVIACFPVYRTYVSKSDGVHGSDRAHVETAVRRATERNPSTDPAVFYFIRDVVLQQYAEATTDAGREEQLRFAGKFQQVTAPVTAKGVEDTAFYVYNRFVSLNEVGGEPGHFGVSPDKLHRYFQDRQSHWPHALSALSTHDTKRSEDVRARLNVLSEMPDSWAEAVLRWRRFNEAHRRPAACGSAPSPDDEYLLYQTLVGAYPLAGAHDGTFVQRIQSYMQKAMREAKVFTSWTSPNKGYETGVREFVGRILDEGAFLEDFRRFVAPVAKHGLLNSLAQTVLKLAAPGVPDTYQGTELWDFSLVDPDNRRPVDYDRRRGMLGELTRGVNVRDLLASTDDGRVKLFVTARLLHARRSHPGLFSAGEYLPLEATGPRRDNVFAFIRRSGGRSAVVAVPRLVTRIARHAKSDNGRLVVRGGPHFRNLFTGETVEAGPEGIALSEVFKQFPVAVLTSAD
jgi:(1->4)-alpha-D-glucan 1-alpha-D-glucosylmutase